MEPLSFNGLGGPGASASLRRSSTARAAAAAGAGGTWAVSVLGVSLSLTLAEGGGARRALEVARALGGRSVALVGTAPHPN